MASKSHDPSSSELLTDFDISDVVSWEEQTYGPKTINFNDLLNSHGSQSQSERPKPRQTHESQSSQYLERSRGLPTTSHSSLFGNESIKTDSHHPLFPDPDNVDLPPITPPCVSPDIEKHPLHSSVFGSNSQMHHEPEQDGLSFSGLEALQKISSEPLDRHSNEPSGLEALRAEVDNVTSYQSKKESPAPTTVARNSPSSFLNAFSPQSTTNRSPLQSQPPMQTHVSSPTTQTTAAFQNPSASKLQTNQQVQQIVIPDGQLNSNPVFIQIPGVGGKGQSPLKGQLVKTADQKLMFVTEIGGKKVGYFIRQPAATVSATPTVASPTVAAQTPVNASPIVTATPSPISSNNSTAFVSDDSIMSPSKKSKQDSSDDDTTPLSRVAESLKNTMITQPSKKGRKKKEKGKKKKDPRKPTKPVTAYQFFFKDIQASIRQQNPTASFGEVSKIVSQMWENLPFASRKGYQEKGDQAKEEYLTKLQEYRSVLAQESLSSQQMDSDSPLAIGSPTTSQQSPEVKFVDERTDIPFDLSIHNYSSSTTISGQNLERKTSPVDDADGSSLQQYESPVSRTLPASNAAIIPTKKKGSGKEKKLKLQQQQQPLQLIKKKSNTIPSSGSPTCLTVPKKSESADISNQTSPTSKFKIPKKNEPKLGITAENGVTKAASVKICIREGCSNPSKHSRDRGSAYCSTDCLIRHCKNSFSSWVIEHRGEHTPVH